MALEESQTQNSKLKTKYVDLKKRIVKYQTDQHIKRDTYEKYIREIEEDYKAKFNDYKHKVEEAWDAKFNQVSLLHTMYHEGEGRGRLTSPLPYGEKEMR